MQIPLNQIGSNATAPGTPLGDTLQAAKGFVCDMYQNYPDWSLGDPTGFGAIARGIWDNFCAPDRGPLPPPVLPPPGGQCECRLYNVGGDFRLFGPTQQWTASLKGPIGNPRLYAQPNGLLAFGFYHQNEACNGWQVFNIVANFTQADWENETVFGSMTAIAPADGQPDLCGNAPPVYPPIIPPAPYLDRQVDINLSPTIIIPVGLVYIRPNVNIDVDATANIDVGVNVSADIGIDFNFNLGGVNISFGGGGGGNTPVLPSPDPRPNPPQPPTQPLPPGTGDIIVDLSKIEALLKDIKDCACEPERPKLTTQYAVANNRKEAIPATCFAATIEVTTVPANGAGQWGGGTAPDVAYAGWAWFNYEDGGLSERLPIDSLLKAFIPPRSGPVGFAYTLKQGYTGILRIHYFQT